jgi:hypothetical protein
MNKLLQKAIIIAATGFALLYGSCTPEACFEETESFLKGTLYSYSTKKLLAADTLSLWGSNNGSSLVYNNSIKLSKVLFPLDASSGTSSFVIKINGITDNVEITYTSYPHLISKECGYTFYHNIETITFTKNVIDSVHIGKYNITTLNEENIRIYY